MTLPTAATSDVSQLLPDLVVNAPQRFERYQPMGDRWVMRLDDFLRPEVAAAVHDELESGLAYERVELAEITRLWRGERELGDAYFGALQRRQAGEAPRNVQAVYELFAHPWLHDLLSRLLGREITYLRPPTPNRMERGDLICAHDDLSDSRHCVSVVLNLSKNWQRGYGGNTVVGEVTRIEDLPTPLEIPFQLQRWYFGRSRKVLTPKYNSMVLIRLQPGLAHSVTPVRVDRPRLALVDIFGCAS
jgi:hypothetical protein